MSYLIYQTISELVATHQTRDPLEILNNMHVIVREKSNYDTLKGYCLLQEQGADVVINSALDKVTKRIVAAHELGHLILHKPELRVRALFDTDLCCTNTKLELEANLFAADLLLQDEEVLFHCNDTTPDVFTMARVLWTLPELLNLKLLSMKKRGHNVIVPLPIVNPLC